MSQNIKQQTIRMTNIYLFIGFILISFFICSCEACKGPTPIPKDKESFIGTWRSGSGFELEIMEDGQANIYQNTDPTNPDYENLNIKAGPEEILDAHVNFLENNKLQIIKPLSYAREYKINQPPYPEDNKYKMVLNRTLLIRR